MNLKIYNDTLDSKIWNVENNTLKEEVKNSLYKIATDFYKNTDLKGDIKDVLFLGSVANYNYTPTSDIDLHVVIDISQEKINPDYSRKFMDALSVKWNTQHDIEIEGHPVEVYLQDILESNSNINTARQNSAIYSILNDKWIVEPNKTDIKIDGKKIVKK